MATSTLNTFCCCTFTLLWYLDQSTSFTAGKLHTDVIADIISSICVLIGEAGGSFSVVSGCTQFMALAELRR